MCIYHIKAMTKLACQVKLAESLCLILNNCANSTFFGDNFVERSFDSMKFQTNIFLCLGSKSFFTDVKSAEKSFIILDLTKNA